MRGNSVRRESRLTEIVEGAMQEPLMTRENAYGSGSQFSAARRSGRARRAERLGALVFATICLSSVLTRSPRAASHRSGLLVRSAVLTPCVTPSINMMDYLDTVVVSSDSDMGIWQRRTLHLPAGPVSMVSAVTDSAICH